MSVSTQLIEARRAAKISQQDLAHAVKKSAQTIYRWEKNEAVPNASDLLALANALNTTVGYFFEEADPAPSGTAPLVDASSAMVNALITAGHNHVVATTAQQVTSDFSNVPQLAIQMKKQGNIAEMKDAIDFLESAISVLKRAVQESVPA